MLLFVISPSVTVRMFFGFASRNRRRSADEEKLRETHRVSYSSLVRGSPDLCMRLLLTFGAQEVGARGLPRDLFKVGKIGLLAVVADEARGLAHRVRA